MADEQPQQEEPQQEEQEQQQEEPKQEEPKQEEEEQEEAAAEPKQEEEQQQEAEPQQEPEKEEPAKEEPKKEEEAATKEEKPSDEQQESKPTEDETAKKEEKSDDKPKDEEKKEEKEEDKGPPPDWELYYWQGFGGRATVIRFCFELAGIVWSEACKGKDANKAAVKVKGVDVEGYPNFAFPIVKHKGYIISQTPAICMYILGQTEYKIDDHTDNMHALQVVLTAWDALAEWAGKMNKLVGFSGWITSRIGGYLSVLEAQLKRNNEGKGWYFGDKVSVADVFVADFMRRYKYAKPDHYKNCPFNLLKEHAKRFEEIEQIKKYIESKRYTTMIGKKFVGL